MSREYPLTFYNLDNNRPDSVTDKEVLGLLNERPAVLGLCECVGVHLPEHEDYKRIRNTGTQGRANLCAYVKKNLEVSDIQWWDMTETWSRTETTGTHWPRSILEFRAGRLKVWVAHQPPKGTDNTKAAQQESIDKLEARMAPWSRDDWDDKPQEEKEAAKDQIRVLLWDSNRKPGEDGPGPDMLAKRIDGHTIGAQIDNSVYRGNEIKTGKDAHYPSSAGGVPLAGDHHDCFQYLLVCHDS